MVDLKVVQLVRLQNEQITNKTFFESEFLFHSLLNPIKLTINFFSGFHTRPLESNEMINLHIFNLKFRN